MDSNEREQILRHIDAWRVAGEFLERERRARLRAMTDEECRGIIADLLSLPLPALPDKVSGLVEQQRLFRRLG
jgi:hypothetical protein